VPLINLDPRYAFNAVTATHKVFSLKKRIRAVAGGTSASKTISILFWLIDYAQVKHKRPKLITIVSETYPHLEGGVMRDFMAIMKDRGYWKESLWHGTKHIYTTEAGNEIQFMAVDTYGKAHGPRRDVLYVNECNNLDYKIVDQLITRTRETVWLDWNPSEEFWFYTEMQPNRGDIDFLTVTYQDNEALDQVTVDEIESHRHNKNWWKVYGLGQLGEVEGRIYTGWQIIDDIPHEARLERRGLDFGYSHDPAAIVDVYSYNGGYIVDEQLYQIGMSNRALANFIDNMETKVLTVADSAEPKSIDEMKLHGVSVTPAIKGQGSLNQGIQFVQDQRISVTKSSVNLIKEYRRYMWQTDKDGKILTVPEGGEDHLLDALRYAFSNMRPGPTPKAHKPAASLQLKRSHAVTRR
jgi:phage terminase large subunit